MSDKLREVIALALADYFREPSMSMLWDDAAEVVASRVREFYASQTEPAS